MINIADRLHSTATEQTVAGANEIYDDAKGKKQDVINQENDEHFSDLEDESVRVVPQEFTQTEQAQARQNLNTYSKNEVNQIASAFTEQNYVSVQAVAATTAADIATLINATGEGERTDTIYRVGWFDGTAFDVTKYSEYTWNGTAYLQMAVRSTIGEVFDISVYNQSGGTPVQYETLALALGTNGANVPSGVRQGGMSVKFIQSSDNKYVQARCMAKNFTTDVTQWQGVDDEPIAGSDNLVKSGGVYKITNLEPLSKNQDDFTISGKFIAKPFGEPPHIEGSIYSDAAFNLMDSLDVSDYNKITINFAGYSIYSYAVGFYTANGTFISGLDIAGTFDIPVNTKYIKACYRISSYPNGVKITLMASDSRIDRLERNVANIQDDIVNIQDDIVNIQDDIAETNNNTNSRIFTSNPLLNKYIKELYIENNSGLEIEFAHWKGNAPQHMFGILEKGTTNALARIVIPNYGGSVIYAEDSRNNTVLKAVLLPVEQISDLAHLTRGDFLKTAYSKKCSPYIFGKQLDDELSNLSSLNITKQDFIYRGYVNTSGVIIIESAGQPNWRTDYISVIPGQKLINYYNGNIPNLMYCVAFFDNTKTFIEGYQTDNVEITVPENATYVIFTINVAAGSSEGVKARIKIEVVKSIKEISDSLDNANSELMKIDADLYENDTKTQDDFTVSGKFIAKPWDSSHVDGSIYSDAAFNLMDSLDVSDYNKITINFAGYSIYSYAVGFYTANGTFISGLDIAGTFDIPVNTKYIKACYRISSYPNGVSIILSGSNLIELDNRLSLVEEEVANNTEDINDLKEKEATKTLNTTGIYDVNLIIIIGQSLAIGAQGGSIDLSGDYKNTIELTNNAITDFSNASSSITSDSFILSSSKTSGTETPVRGLVTELVKSITDENQNFLIEQGTQFALWTIGTGGIDINAIISYLQNTKNNIEAYINKVHSEGKTIGIPVIGWIQGEADNRVWDYGELYYTKLGQYFDALSDFIIGKTDQVNRTQFVLYQTSGYEAFNNDDKRMNIALKQFELMLNRNDVHVAAPMYPYSFAVDRTHVLHFGTRMTGAAMGEIAKQLIINNNHPKPFRLLKKSIFKNSSNKYIINLEFEVPVPPLVLDDRDIENPANQKSFSDQNENVYYADNYGFELRTTGWTQEVDDHPIRTNQWTEHWTAPKLVNWGLVDIIENVQVVRNTIKITCSSDPTGLELWYARRGAQGGGYVHDSQNKTILISGNSYRVYNWMPIMLIQL